jgi:hypothetical protein
MEIAWIAPSSMIAEKRTLDSGRGRGPVVDISVFIVAHETTIEREFRFCRGCEALKFAKTIKISSSRTGQPIAQWFDGALCRSALLG